MATSFKTLGNGDIQATRNNLHEAVPITGSITSGTYAGAAGATACADAWAFLGLPGDFLVCVVILN